MSSSSSIFLTLMMMIIVSSLSSNDKDHEEYLEKIISENLAILTKFTGNVEHKIGNILETNTFKCNGVKNRDGCNKALSSHKASWFSYSNEELLTYLQNPDDEWHPNEIFDVVKKSGRPFCLQRMSSDLTVTWNAGDPQIIIQQPDGCVRVTASSISPEHSFDIEEEEIINKDGVQHPIKFDHIDPSHFLVVGDTGCQLEIFYEGPCSNTVPETWWWEMNCLFGFRRFVELGDMFCAVHNEVSKSDPGVYSFAPWRTADEIDAFMRAKNNIRNVKTLQAFQSKNLDVPKSEIDKAQQRATKGEQMVKTFDIGTRAEQKAAAEADSKQIYAEITKRKLHAAVKPSATAKKEAAK